MKWKEIAIEEDSWEWKLDSGWKGYVCKFRKMIETKAKATIYAFNNEFLNTINKNVSSWVHESPLAAIVFLIINSLNDNNARVFFKPSIWSFTLFDSIAIYLVRLHWMLDWCKQDKSFLSLPLELDFFRSMLDRSKPFTLDKDRSFLNRSICASVNGV